MRITFLSNYFMVHQLPFCQYLYNRFGDDFCFVATTKIPAARLAHGYSDMNSAYPFVIRSYESKAQREEAQRRTDEADVVILGSAPMAYLKNRLAAKKLTFLYSERLYKSGYEAWKLPVRLVSFYKKYGKHKSLYLLCASAYTAPDFAKTRTFLNKAYKWGYFPETKNYSDPEALVSKKKSGTILWVSRFLALKHPEHVVEVARRLKEENYDFQIQMVGSGQLWDAMSIRIQALGLQDQVILTGSVPAEEVRSYMEEASVFLFTSDRHEGWGAVLNESMNSGCAVVASSAVGSVPFLLEDNKNGIIYTDGDVDDLYAKVKHLLDNPQTCAEMGKAAYETIAKTWNAEAAAERLLTLSELLLQGEKRPQPYEDGPCSKASHRMKQILRHTKK